MIISLDRQFSLQPDILAEELNKKEYLAGYQLDKTFTSVKGWFFHSPQFERDLWNS